MNPKMKNIPRAQVLDLKEQIAYQPGQVVSKILAQNSALSITLFSFAKGEEISTHESGGDAFVTCLDGENVSNRQVTLRLSDSKVNFFGPAGCDPNATAWDP